jgi:hypothetical protein
VHHHTQALAIAERLAADLAPGTLGIGLFGSVAKGTDHPHSDIDLILATDTGAGTEVRQVEGRMVTLTRKTPADLEGAFERPWEAPTAVAAWREARLLHDPDGVMARLQARSHAWTWAAIDGVDAWAAGELVGLAEEVHKVHGMLAAGRVRAAAANRAILALQLAFPLAAAHRLTCGSENEIWDAVAAAEGPDWAAAWDTAAGVTPADHESGCRAALALYRIAADRLAHHLDAGDRAIVDTARDLTI